MNNDEYADYYLPIMLGIILGVALATARIVFDSVLETTATLKAIYILLRDNRRDETEAAAAEIHPAESLDGLLDNVAKSATRGRNAKEADIG